MASPISTLFSYRRSHNRRPRGFRRREWSDREANASTESCTWPQGLGVRRGIGELQSTESRI